MIRAATTGFYFLCLSFGFAQMLNAQALHWVSPPLSDLGLVHNGQLDPIALSANGRYLAFRSDASNIVANDTNGIDDLFIKDLQTGTTVRANLTDAGQEAADGRILSFSAPSNDGRYIAFTSETSNFPGYIGFSQFPLYVKDLQTGDLLVESLDGSNQPFSVNYWVDLSSDARYLAFGTLVNANTGVADGDYAYRKDRQSGTFELASIDAAGDPFIDATYRGMSRNGRYMALFSDDTDTPTGLDTRLYLRDMDFATTLSAHVTPSGMPSEADAYPSEVAVSNNGHVVFCSFASDLVSGDTNNIGDYFLFDGISNTRVSLDENGNQVGDGSCVQPEVEIDNLATRALFRSHSSELLPGVDNGNFQVFMRNLVGGTTRLVSESDIGEPSDGNSYYMALSGDGATALFASEASNLTTEPIAAVYRSLYEYNAAMDAVSLVPIATQAPVGIIGGVAAPVMSADHRWVVYATAGPNATEPAEFDGTTDLILVDRMNGDRSRIGQSIADGYAEALYDLSSDGRFIVFASDRFHPVTDIVLDEVNVFLYDRVLDSYAQIAAGESPRVNNDGNVVFQSEADDLVGVDDNDVADIFIYERLSQTISRVSEGPGGAEADLFSLRPDIAGSGAATWITFVSRASNLMSTTVDSSDQQVYARNWPAGPAILVSAAEDGLPGDEDSFDPRLSGDTQTIVFATDATNLTDDNYVFGSTQVLAFDRVSGSMEVVSLDTSGIPHLDPLNRGFLVKASVSFDGRYVAFTSAGIGLVNDDDNDAEDVFLFDRTLDLMSKVSQSADGSIHAVSGFAAEIAVNDDLTPPLVGVAMSASSNILGLDPQPKGTQAYVYQQGGPGVSLEMQVTGNGQVAGNLGYSCDANCNDVYPLGTTLDLVAIPDTGFSFLGWSGDVCTDASPTCEVVLNQSLQMQALFESNGPDDVIFGDSFESLP